MNDEIEKTEIDRIMETYSTVISAIKEDQGVDDNFVPPEDILKTIPCPICKKGQMTYSISSYNGHRHAQCSDNCFGLLIE